MGSLHNYVPIRNTRRYLEAQHDETFGGWLAMQEAAIPLIFVVDEVPAIRSLMFEPESLDVTESALMELYPTKAASRETDAAIDTTMRFVYYFGETFRRALEGTWVALPRENGPGLNPAIDLPFREEFIQPRTFISFALGRRTGNQVSRIFGFAKTDYDEWIASGRPERIIRGTLTEDGST